RRFAALGDSLSAGAEGDSSTPWPERAARALPGDGGELAFRNFAVAGATSTDVAIWQLQKAVEFNPDLISVICGANDVLLSVRPDPEVFTAVFDGIVDSLQRRLPEASIVTATYPRIGSLLPLRERTSARIHGGIEAINVAIREIAARRGLVCLEWAGDPGVDDPDNFARDQFHPSSEGHRRAAAAFVEGVAATLGPCVPDEDAA
ncbi:MAG TPA: SGNH/GDSL hydrolase family protein, partial [Thermoleophilaceae bacterium]|nr:SGNH/GDSL hydrolase family protein [Thermoleophilaceae bacterium]